MAQASHILQVSELTKKVRFILESELNTVWLCGEISNFMAAGSGHWYLSLKDAKSQVKCAMFKGANRKVRIKPTNGQQVLVKAKVSLYEPRGDFQLILEQMEPAGEGLLRQEYEQLKHKLDSAGYFSSDKKQALPANIKTVGIVTSPTGAAIKDIIAVFKRRSPMTQLIIYPSLVQGKQAANDIALAINIANQRNECDVLLVTRGGGSLEDLWPFNEEVVVNSIYHSKLPIISAVGHEIDTTLSDYAADLRAPTPSSAAELTSTNADEIKLYIQQLQQKLVRSTLNNIQQLQTKQQHIQHRLSLTHPQQKLHQQQQKIDELQQRVVNAYQQYLANKKTRPLVLQQKLANHSPVHTLNQQKHILRNLQQRLLNQTQQSLHNKQQQFASLIEQLNIVSPLATIARGYSVVRTQESKIVKHINEVQTNDFISIQVSDGTIYTKVSSVEKND